jgi:hypothetical protein
MEISTRDDAYEIERLAEQLAGDGPRPAASPAEARAAAVVNARLRRAGMGVSTYELRSASRPGGAYALIAALGLAVAALTPALPAPSLAGALLLLLALLYDAAGAPLPPLRARAVSQNIVGTRAVAGAGGLAPRRPRWRVLILAPLDTPPARRGLARLAGPERGPVLARLAAGALLALAAALAAFAPAAPWPLALAAAALLLLATLVADMLPLAPGPADGGLAALAALVVAASRLGTLERVEVWAAAVGAAGSDQWGAASLARRFPFEPEMTVVIALEQLDSGQLVYGTREGALVPRRADPLLLRLAAAADGADPRIDAEPRPLAGAGGLAAPLRRRGLRALTVVGRPALAAAPADPALIERAARLVAGIVRGLEREP